MAVKKEMAATPVMSDKKKALETAMRIFTLSVRIATVEKMLNA